VERIWSAGGNVVTPKRANLAAENVEKQVFLHEDLEFMPL
jgi:hypothetical protein